MTVSGTGVLGSTSFRVMIRMKRVGVEASALLELLRSWHIDVKNALCA